MLSNLGNKLSLEMNGKVTTLQIHCVTCEREGTDCIR